MPTLVLGEESGSEPGSGIPRLIEPDVVKLAQVFGERGLPFVGTIPVLPVKLPRWTLRPRYIVIHSAFVSVD